MSGSPITAAVPFSWPVAASTWEIEWKLDRVLVLNWYHGYPDHPASSSAVLSESISFSVWLCPHPVIPGLKVFKMLVYGIPVADFDPPVLDPYLDPGSPPALGEFL